MEKVCNVCGENHDIADCQFFFNLKYVKDEPLISRARQTLPKDLKITRMADGSSTIVAKCDLQQGTTFGPLQAKRDRTMNPMNDFPIKIFGKDISDTRHLDLSDEDTSNWMCFVSPASNSGEQNLVCYQMQRDIYYSAIRFIPTGEELRVWYAPYYALKMKMPLLDTEEFGNTVDDSTIKKIEETNRHLADNKEKSQMRILPENIHEIAERLPAQQLGARGDRTSWSCRICSSVISSVIEYAKHLMEHYKPLSGFFCNICNKKCYRNSVLQKHKRLKHPETRTNDLVGIPTSENQRLQNTQTILMNMSDSEGQTSEAMKDILEKFKAGKAITEISSPPSTINPAKDNNELPLLDTHSLNVNDLLQNNVTLLENSSLKSILENQCLNMNLGLGSITDSILVDNINGVDTVKFNVDELASDLLDITPDLDNINRRIGNLECDICEKKFEKVDYLYRHLRKHTGEFICPNCLAVFARKENLVSHLCPSQKVDRKRYECLYCQKPFLMKKYLKRHMIRHTEWNICKWCRNLFTTRTELEAHKCQAPKNVCTKCGKCFVHREHLNRHAKLHIDPKPVIRRTRKKSLTDKPVICEKCGDVFKNPYSLKQHLRSHGERLFECDVCHSKFHRIGVLQQHKSIHQSVQIPCQICGKKLKSKKALSVHVLLHGNRKYHCEKCDKSFFQKCNYLKHYRQLHSEKTLHKCPHCPTQFTSESSFNKHVECHEKPTQHPCTSCHKIFHREYQLKRHVQTNHSGIVFRCPYCNMTARYRHSMKRHFERQHKNVREEWDKPGFVNHLIEKTSTSLMIERIFQRERNDKVTTYDGANISEFHASPDEAQNLIIPVKELNEKQFTDQADIQENVSTNIEASALDAQKIVLQVSDQAESTIRNTELTDEVPQLSITDNANLEDIFGEEAGNIMFYVLDNTPVVDEY